MPDAFYHIVCRGNRRDALFMDDGDFKLFLHIINQVNKKTPFELASYCLMTNHFHLQLRSKEQPFSKVMSLINKRYADYYNTKNNLTGHVFEKRYYDKIIYSNLGMLEVSRYIHLNPVAAKMVERPEQYPWSSYRYYLHTSSNHLLNMDVLLDYYSGDAWEKRRTYREFVEEDRAISSTKLGVDDRHPFERSRSKTKEEYRHNDGWTYHKIYGVPNLEYVRSFVIYP